MVVFWASCYDCVYNDNYAYNSNGSLTRGGIITGWSGSPHSGAFVSYFNQARNTYHYGSTMHSEAVNITTGVRIVDSDYLNWPYYLAVGEAGGTQGLAPSPTGDANEIIGISHDEVWAVCVYGTEWRGLIIEKTPEEKHLPDYGILRSGGAAVTQYSGPQGSQTGYGIVASLFEDVEVTNSPLAMKIWSDNVNGTFLKDWRWDDTVDAFISDNGVNTVIYGIEPF